MSRQYCLLIAFSFIAVPGSGLAQDRRIDPDPSFVPKARTMALAAVDENYDLMSHKVPFPVRFAACAGKLTAARQDGRAMPLGAPETQLAAANFRALAVDLHAHRRKLTKEAAVAAIDKDIAEYVSGAVKIMRDDTPRLGVARMKVLNTEHLQACRLMRAWYEVQNGLKPPVPAAEMPSIAAANARFRAGEKAAAAPAPGRNTVTAFSPDLAGYRPGPSVPQPGTPYRDNSPRDSRVGTEVNHAGARQDFEGRPLWTALAECSGRFQLIETKTGMKLAEHADSLRRQAAFVLAYERRWNEADTLAWVPIERKRLEPRINAWWNDFERQKKAAPTAIWISSCNALINFAGQYSKKLAAAYGAEQRAAWEARQRARAAADAAARAQQLANQPSQQSTGGGGWSSSSTPSYNPGAAAAQRHQGVMQQYERENRQIRNETRQIERRYGLGR